MLGSPMHEVNHPNISFPPGSMHDYGGGCGGHFFQPQHHRGEEEEHKECEHHLATTTMIHSSADSSPLSSSPPITTTTTSNNKYTSVTSITTSTTTITNANRHDDDPNDDGADKALLFNGGGSCPCFCRDETETSALSSALTMTTTTTTTTTLISDEDGFAFSGFEGPEKKLEVIFSCGGAHQDENNNIKSKGLRMATAAQWQSMLDEAHCKIISITSNRHLDSYVLSESSLFVYPFRIVLKTCGTTTLLFCIPKLLEIAAGLGLSVERVFFSRKNYVFPHKQLFPHTSFVDETTFLDQFFSGSCYILGSVKKDHWYLYVADHRNIESRCYNNNNKRNESDEYNLEIMMHDLDTRVMDQFFKRDDFVSSSHVTETSGISDLLPGSVIDAFMFDPCGYSMNGLLDNSYSTIHITPEKQCSFVSYETNVSASYLRKHLNLSHADLVRRVLRTFKPGRATVTLRTCNAGGTTEPPVLLPTDDEFVATNAKMYRFDGGVSLAFFNVFQESD